jgi:hypothetical protein
MAAVAGQRVEQTVATGPIVASWRPGAARKTVGWWSTVDGISRIVVTSDPGEHPVERRV